MKILLVLPFLALPLACSDETVAQETAPQVSIATTQTSAQQTETLLEADFPLADAYPNVIGATAEIDDDGTWNISATLSSTYDSPKQYADAWRVLDSDGTELGVRILTHDHANEQPFTRSQSGIEIPSDVDIVVIEGRDLINGWGGDSFELRLTR